MSNSESQILAIIQKLPIDSVSFFGFHPQVLLNNSDVIDSEKHKAIYKSVIVEVFPEGVTKEESKFVDSAIIRHCIARTKMEALSDKRELESLIAFNKAGFTTSKPKCHEVHSGVYFEVTLNRNKKPFLLGVNKGDGGCDSIYPTTDIDVMKSGLDALKNSPEVGLAWKYSLYKSAFETAYIVDDEDHGKEFDLRQIQRIDYRLGASNPSFLMFLMELSDIKRRYDKFKKTKDKKLYFFDQAGKLKSIAIADTTDNRNRVMKSDTGQLIESFVDFDAF